MSFATRRGDNGGSVSVLIIEDEPYLRGELASALTEAGFTVVSVRDYLEALQKLVAFEPDIAIVDEALPSGNGKVVCFQLRRDFGFPVILMGVASGGEAWMRAVKAGAEFYFEKPVHYKEAVARVKAILRRYKETRASLLKEHTRV